MVLVVHASSSYDDLPYESRVLPFTHPISIATMATLYGMSPPAVETCRVLEIGCATGDNLLSMAVTLPKATFVGIDNSPREIDVGLERLRATGISNVDFRCVSLMDLQPDVGKFDYIICHGVYSWVSPEVSDRLLSLYARHLSPHGIGYLSYNTYPGWHIKSIIRETLRYHVRAIPDVKKQVEEARKFLHALGNSVPKQDEIYHKVLQDGAEDMDTYRDDYVYHEFLEEWNCPVYIWELMERLSAKGLAYVGPAKFSRWETSLPADVQQALAMIPDRVAREQYLDYFGNRTFRKSLLCRAGNTVLDRPSLTAFQKLFVSTDLRPLMDEAVQSDLVSSDPMQFRAPSGDELTTNKPYVKLALHHVSQSWPRVVPFESIWRAIEPLLPTAGEAECSRTSLAQALFQCVQGNIVECAIAESPCALSISSRPCASPLARSQALTSELVANLRHRLVRLSDIERMIVAHLDGTRDREDVCRLLLEAIDRGELDLLDKEGLALKDPALRQRCVQQQLDPCLQQLALHGLLLE